jgi:hypothetical protein
MGAAADECSAGLGKTKLSTITSSAKWRRSAAHRSAQRRLPTALPLKQRARAGWEPASRAPQESRGLEMLSAPAARSPAWLLAAMAASPSWCLARAWACVCRSSPALAAGARGRTRRWCRHWRPWAAAGGAGGARVASAGAAARGCGAGAAGAAARGRRAGAAGWRSRRARRRAGRRPSRRRSRCRISPCTWRIEHRTWRLSALCGQ